MGGCDRLIFRTAMLIVVLASTLFRVRVTYAEDYFESDPPLFWFGATGGLTVERRDPSLAYGLDVGAQLFVHNTIVALDVDALRQIQGARASVIFHTSFFGAELRTRYSYCCDRPYERRYVRGIKGFKFGVEIGKAPLDTFMTLEFGISRRSQHIWEVAFAIDPVRKSPGISFDVSRHFGWLYYGVNGRGLLGNDHPLSIIVLGSIGISSPMRWKHR